ncbi:MAG: hypothetical protein EOP52_03665 [Sphingobacteriales bacterium]|nr:MAG: hypothetical protein EOP52_03665 [Sphingobacteriales bacterium]
MVAYFTDVTLFWSISLLTYLGLFRKTTFHSTNRIVLLGTLLLGLLLPLWPQSIVVAPASVPQFYFPSQVAHISTAKAAVVEQVVRQTRPAFALSISLLYGIGCVIAALFYLRGAFQLTRLTRSSCRRTDSGMTFYETGIQHAPFSFLGKTFLTAAAQYTPTDLRLILQHERRHRDYRHTVDVLLLLVLRIVFWFHPLVYLYDYLLKQVHEFQADAFARAEPQPYGYLLLQEGTSHSFSLVHSFSHSPLKNRIFMLTRTSTPSLLKLQYLLLAPVLFLAVEACQKKDTSGIASKKEARAAGSKSDTSFVFNGNTFYQHASVPFYWVADSNAAMPADSIEGFDIKDYKALAITEGTPAFQVIGDIYKMNEEPVYTEDKVTTPVRYKGSYKNALEELVHRIEPALAHLSNGEYNLHMGDLVVSKEGKLVLYRDFGVANPAANIEITQANMHDLMKNVPKSLLDAVSQPVVNAMEQALAQGFAFEPAVLDGKPVASTLQGFSSDVIGLGTVIVQDGTVRISTEEVPHRLDVRF